jgi:rod shape-determining protein MreD
MDILGARPNAFLILIAGWSFFLERKPATAFGFFAGIIQGATAGANLTHYAISCTVTAFAAASSRELRLERHVAMVLATGFAVTLLARLLFMFLAAPPGLGSYLGATILSGLMNGALVVPLFWLLSKLWARETH